MKRASLIVKIILAVMVFASMASVEVGAKVNIIPKTQFNLEKPPSEVNASLAPPDSIYVLPLFLESPSFISDEDWYRGLYYYLTFRLNQGDFLFHYIVNKKGEVYEGLESGEQQRIDIQDVNDSPIVVAYLAGKGDINFEKDAYNGLSELLLDIANRNAIKLNKISVSNIEFVAREGEAIRARTSIIGGRWERNLDDMIDAIRPRYKPVTRKYSFKVEKVNLPTDPVNLGDNVVIDITLQNTSDFFFYQATGTEPIISKQGASASKFYVNDIWLSQTQASLVPENTILEPGESGTFQVRLKVPLYFGKQTETFELIDSLGKPYPKTKFTITLTVNRPQKQIVEITQTETGQLNVRKSASGYSEVINRVTPGQRFIVLERSGTGWVKLKIESGKNGWVVEAYTRTV